MTSTETYPARRIKRERAPRLERHTFSTSRLAEFCDRRNLVTATGTGETLWPVYVAKELVDNAADACEEASVAEPEITIEVAEDRITVADNGPGLPAEVLDRILDYNIRTSSREAYVSPTRGAQGNALQTVLAMPYALDGATGRVTIEALGQCHNIEFCINEITRTPQITRSTAEGPFVKTGTKVTVHCPQKASYLLANATEQILQNVEYAAAFNPHIRFVAHTDGEDEGDEINLVPIDPKCAKWLSRDPTSPHWYDVERLERLIAAYINDGKGDRPIREFVAEFAGLHGSAKPRRVLDDAGLTRATLRSLAADDSFDHSATTRLLRAMQAHARQIRPEVLGVIGADNWQAMADYWGGSLETFQYRKVTGETGGIPWVIEAAFCSAPEADRWQLVTGVNFSAALVNPFQGYRGLAATLADQWIDEDASVLVFAHVTCPRIDYLDRGKTSIELPGGRYGHATVALRNAITAVTQKWAKQMRAEDRHASAAANREAKLVAEAHKPKRVLPEKPDPTGVLAEKITAAAAAAGMKQSDLLVLSKESDPYHAWRYRKDAEWCAEWFHRLYPAGTPQKHVRGFFYALVSRPDAMRPNGEPFHNTHPNWSWLQRRVKAARWLTLIPFERIIDQRNEPPQVFTRLDDATTGEPQLLPGSPVGPVHIPAPELAPLLPTACCPSFSVRQLYRIVLWGEKSSLRSVLLPIASAVEGELVLATGEASDTIIAGVAQRAALDGRPTVVFYFSDFDPAGQQMPTSVSRKLQALRDLCFPGLEITVYYAALTAEQVRQFGLPSTPLKKTDKRSRKWRAIYRHEQTEIDALAELRPDVLRQIALDAIAPFHDETLSDRVAAAEAAWHRLADARLRADPGYVATKDKLIGLLETFDETIKQTERAFDGIIGEIKTSAE